MCFPKKPFKKHYKQIKEITRTLGAVRDLDVLIARFEEAVPPLSDAEKFDVQTLIAYLQEKREETRKPMLALFEKLQAANFQKKFIRDFTNTSHIVLHQSPSTESCPQPDEKKNRKHLIAHARKILPAKAEKIYAWEHFIFNPANREELHKMRIAMKRLRYTMGFFDDIYKFRGFHNVIIRLQRQIGRIHDCDITLDLLTDYQRTHPHLESPGIATLIERTRKTREADYKAFLKRWEKLTKTQFRRKLFRRFLYPPIHKTSRRKKNYHGR